MSHYPTAESTMALLTEGQLLKQKLREQYADEIEKVLRARSESVESYYKTKLPDNILKGMSSSPNGSKTESCRGDTALEGGDVDVSVQSKNGREAATPPLSKRQELVALGYLPPSDDDDVAVIRKSFTNVSASSTSTPSKRAQLIKCTTKAIEEADDRERRLKALIDAHDPIRQSLRAVQEHAIQSLIYSTETSLAWEMRLAAEEADANSPIHRSRQQSQQNATVFSEGASASSPTETTPTKSINNAPTTADATSDSHLFTSPFREGGSAKEKEALEKRLGLLLKLQVEHRDQTLVEKAVDKNGLIYDERKRFVEEAVDVMSRRDMQAAQEAARNSNGTNL